MAAFARMCVHLTLESIRNPKLMARLAKTSRLLSKAKESLGKSSRLAQGLCTLMSAFVEAIGLGGSSWSAPRGFNVTGPQGIDDGKVERQRPWYARAADRQAIKQRSWPRQEDWLACVSPD